MKVELNPELTDLYMKFATIPTSDKVRKTFSLTKGITARK